LIGIQARSGSTRLPGKCSMSISEEQTLAGHVMREAARAAEWLQQTAGLQVSVAMLIPWGDPIRGPYEDRYEVFEGPEDDVLGRFEMARALYEPDYIVRLTADCAWMQRRVIVQLVRAAIKYGGDYTSNTLIRTFMEGLDVEVLTSRLLRHLVRTVDDPAEREHVTSAIPRLVDENGLKGFAIHTVLSDYDYSDIKTSIDTHDEYEACRNLYRERRRKKDKALALGSVST
jgi:spore coat polysaccharide biosynthesis protein SpsF